MLQMANAASAQALEEGKKRLREFLENSETGRQALAMESRDGGESIRMGKLNGAGRAVDEDDDRDDI